MLEQRVRLSSSAAVRCRNAGWRAGGLRRCVWRAGLGRRSVVLLRSGLRVLPARERFRVVSVCLVWAAGRRARSPCARGSAGWRLSCSGASGSAAACVVCSGRANGLRLPFLTRCCWLAGWRAGRPRFGGLAGWASCGLAGRWAGCIVCAVCSCARPVLRPALWSSAAGWRARADPSAAGARRAALLLRVQSALSGTLVGCAAVTVAPAR